jgi:uncharacterized FlaG/YvyC family protein
MATIGHLGAALFNRLTGKNPTQDNLSRQKRIKREGKVEVPIVERAGKSRSTKEVQMPEDLSIEKEKPKEQVKPVEIQRMSIEELAAQLRKVNLTFDMFEIQAKFSVNPKTGEISVEVINQRTGEVIRKVPPYDVPDFIDSFNRGEAMMTDIEV